MHYIVRFGLSVWLAVAGLVLNGGSAMAEGGPSTDCVGKSAVLLIHGLNSYPEVWLEEGNNLVAGLREQGYARPLIGLYHYAGRGSGRDGYNNQGGVAEVAAGMREAVLDLSRASADCGGTGLVDIVAHSMGGLVARYYALEWPTESRLNRIISVGTPYGGSWMADALEFGSPEQWGGGVESLVRLLRQSGRMMGVNVEDQAYVDLRSGSVVQQRLREEPVNWRIGYYALYGDIEAVLALRLFHLRLVSQRYELGDLVVGAESAREVGQQWLSEAVGFSDQVIRELSLGLRLGQGVMELGLIHLDQLQLPYWHNALLSAPEVQQVIFRILHIPKVYPT